MQDPTKESVRIEVLLLCIDRAQADRVHARYREQSAPLVSCFSAKHVGTGSWSPQPRKERRTEPH